MLWLIILAGVLVAWLSIQAKVGYVESVERFGGDELWMPAAVISIIVILFFTALMVL